MSLYVLEPKTENKNITPHYVKQKHNTTLYDGNRKKCKSSLQTQKISTIKIKILYVSF